MTVLDLNSGTITTLKGATGPAGPTEAPGAAGPAGAPGEPGMSGYQVVTASVVVPADSGGEVTAVCPAGERILSAMGYFNISFDGRQEELSADGTRAWAHGYNDNTGTSDVLNVDIVCAAVS